MDDKVTVEFDAETFDALTRQAEAHGRDVGEEVRQIVGRSVRMPMSRSDFLREADAIAALTPKNVRQTDSTLLVREDRDR